MQERNVESICSHEEIKHEIPSWSFIPMPTYVKGLISRVFENSKKIDLEMNHVKKDKVVLNDRYGSHLNKVESANLKFSNFKNIFLLTSFFSIFITIMLSTDNPLKPILLNLTRDAPEEIVLNLKSIKTYSQGKGAKMINIYKFMQNSKKLFLDEFVPGDINDFFVTNSIISEDGKYFMDNLGGDIRRFVLWEFAADNKHQVSKNFLRRIDISRIKELDIVNLTTASFLMSGDKMIISSDNKMNLLNLQNKTKQTYEYAPYKVLLTERWGTVILFKKDQMCRLEFFKNIKTCVPLDGWPSKFDMYFSGIDFNGPYVHNNIIYFYGLRCVDKKSKNCVFDLEIYNIDDISKSKTFSYNLSYEGDSHNIVFDLNYKEGKVSLSILHYLWVWDLNKGLIHREQLDSKITQLKLVGNGNLITLQANKLVKWWKIK